MVLDGGTDSTPQGYEAWKAKRDAEAAGQQAREQATQDRKSKIPSFGGERPAQDAAPSRPRRARKRVKDVMDRIFEVPQEKIDLRNRLAEQIGIQMEALKDAEEKLRVAEEGGDADQIRKKQNSVHVLSKRVQSLEQKLDDAN